MTAALGPPWRVYRGQRPPERLFVHGPKGESVAMVFEREFATGPGWANAHLIAEAPAFRAVLAAAVDEYEVQNGTNANRSHWSVEARRLLDNLATLESRYD